MWYCFAAQVGGDLIALAAHIRKCDVKDAAAWLDGGKTEKAETPKDGTFKPLDLEYDHPAVAALGFSPEDAQALGIGYAGKGIMRGLVALPIRLEDGTLAGYVGVQDIAKLPPRWHGISMNVVLLKGAR